MIAKHPMSWFDVISQSAESVVGPGLFRPHWFRPHAFRYTFGQAFEDKFPWLVMNVRDVTSWSSAALTTRKIKIWKFQIFQRLLNLIRTGISLSLDSALVLWARHLHRPAQKHKCRLPSEVFVRRLQRTQPPSEQKISAFWNLKLRKLKEFRWTDGTESYHKLYIVLIVWKTNDVWNYGFIVSYF